MNSYLDIRISVKYPKAHPTSWINGHRFYAKLDNSEVLTKYAIECVKLNGGEAILESETLVISSPKAATKDIETEIDGLRSGVMIDDIPIEIMDSVFYWIRPVKVIKEAKELWKSINK